MAAGESATDPELRWTLARIAGEFRPESGDSVSEASNPFFDTGVANHERLPIAEAKRRARMVVEYAEVAGLLPRAPIRA